jgi:hypothetical protein
MSRSFAWRVAPVAAAAFMVVVYFVLDPRISDLPAAEFRTWLFEKQGFTIWNGQWYAGHHTPGYSIVFPPLSALLGGPEVVGALSTLASAAIFERIVTRHFGPAARWGALWFGFAAGTLLFSSRLPWGLGATFALGAVLALQHRRVWLAALLGVLATLSSPVAGAFLALGAVAWALADPEHRRDAVIVAASGLLPPMVLTAAFPEGGYHPFVFSSFFIVPLVALAALPFFAPGERTLRIACVLYALAAFGLFLVHTPFGGNTVRLGQLVGGPLVLCAVLAHPPRGTPWRVGAAALLGVLLWWQWVPIVREYRKVADDPSVEASYYKPLLDYVKSQPRGEPSRITIPQLRSQWESYYVAKEIPSGRGWLRQVDVKLNPLFYEGPLTPDKYGRWLGENAVRWVAVPDAPIGYGGKRETELLDRGTPPFLRGPARAGHWRVYEVITPHPLVVPAGGADIKPIRLGTDEVVLDVRRPGDAIVRVHFSPYWRIADGPGCVGEAPGDWTRITAKRAGRIRLVTTFAPGRVVSRGRRCS